MGAAVIVEQVGDRRPRLFQLRDSAQGIHPQGPARTNAAAGNGGKNFRVNFSRQFNGFQERPYSCQDMGEGRMPKWYRCAEMAGRTRT